MTSASIVFKNFNQEFTKRINELSKIMQRPSPDVSSHAAFPLIKGFFTVYPEIHGRCLAKCPTNDDIDDFFSYINEDLPQDITEEQLQAMKPVFYHIAKTIPQINA